MAQLDITADYHTREPIGTFTCACGFIYSRKGPDKVEENKFKIGRIKSFGMVWEKKLNEVVKTKQYGLRELGRIMGCDAKTIVKYCNLLGLQNYISSTMRVEIVELKDNKSSNIDENYRDMYRKEMLSFVNKNPNLTRTQIREKLKKEYSWLYRNDKEWLFLNFPFKQVNQKINEVNKRVNWDERDREVLEEVRRVYYKIVSQEKLKRLTKSLIGHIIGKTALLYYNINKLPETKKYLESIIETVEEFQKKRIDNVCLKLNKEKGYLIKWEVIKAAGLKEKVSLEISRYIEENIIKYNQI